MKSASLIATHNAFGWTVTHMALPAGGAYSYILARDVPRSQLPAVSLWTKGLVSGMNLTRNVAVDDRAPGVLTSDLSREVRAGRFLLTAQEDSEWWCVASKSNKGKLPALSKLSLAAGQTTTVQPSQLLLICAGQATLGDLELVAGATHQATEAGDLTAQTPLLGLFFDRALA